MSDEVFRQCGFVAARNAIAADPTGFQVSGCDGEHVSFPLPGRKSLPGVRCILGRVWTPVHPNGSLGGLPGDVRMEGDDLLSGIVDFFPQAQIRRMDRFVQMLEHSAASTPAEAKKLSA